MPNETTKHKGERYTFTISKPDKSRLTRYFRAKELSPQKWLSQIIATLPNYKVVEVDDESDDDVPSYREQQDERVAASVAKARAAEKPAVLRSPEDVLSAVEAVVGHNPPDDYDDDLIEDEEPAERVWTLNRSKLLQLRAGKVPEDIIEKLDDLAAWQKREPRLYSTDQWEEMAREIIEGCSQ